MEKKEINPDSDEVKYTIKPSQYVNIWWLLLTLSLLFVGYRYDVTYWLAAVSGFIWVCRWFIIYCWAFRINEKTISERKGVFSVHTREIHYFRIKSVRLDEPFLLRIFGISSVILITSDPYIRVLTLYAVEDGDLWMEEIKKEAAKWRRIKGINEHDIHPLT